MTTPNKTGTYDAEGESIPDKASFDELLAEADRLLSGYVEVGIKDAEEGRAVPAHQAIDNIRKKHGL